MDDLHNIETLIYTHQEGIKRKQINYKKEGKQCTRKEEGDKPENILRISYDSQHSASSWNI